MDKKHTLDGDDGLRRPDPAFALERLRQALRGWIEAWLNPLATGLRFLGVSANHVSCAGFALCVVSAGLIVADRPVAAGIVFLVAGVSDLIDGMMARSAGASTRFGAFLDSTVDRASEGVVFAAICYLFARDGAALDVAVAVVALFCSFLVSYTRSRAGELGVACAVGIATRAERVGLIVFGLIFGLLAEAVYLVAILAVVTALQRVVHVRRAMRDDS